jgi:TolA-binding protein
VKTGRTPTGSGRFVSELIMCLYALGCSSSSSTETEVTTMSEVEDEGLSPQEERMRRLEQVVAEIEQQVQRLREIVEQLDASSRPVQPWDRRYRS